MSHLDTRSPYVVDTHELGRRPGASQRLRRVVPAQADLGTDVIRVVEGSDLVLELLLESVMEGVLVSGTVSGSASGECVRCLDDVQRDLSAPLQELFAYPGSSSADDEDVSELVGDHLDLAPVIRDTLVPALPFQPVCRPDCPGLCAQCGARLADEPGHAHEELDPRWAALAGLSAPDDASSLTGGDPTPPPPADPTAPQRADENRS